MRRILFYGVAGGLLIAVLKLIEYKHFVHAYPGELYGGLLALIFTGLGLLFGRRLARRHDHPEALAAPAASQPTTGLPPAGPFAPDAAALARLGVTPREREILELIAAGLSNREIGERAFISENTVKTHSSRLFDKLGVKRRVQAVQRGRELGLIPWGAPTLPAGGQRKDDFRPSAPESPEGMTTRPPARG